MNHWADTDLRVRRFLAARLGTDVPRELMRPVPAWQRRARERALRTVARAFQVPRALLRPHLPTPPYKRNARKYGRG